MTNLKIQKDDSSNKEEYIHIKFGQSITARLQVVRFKDKDTGHYMVYSPAVEISGYGETKEDATKMFNFSLEEYFVFLTDLPQKKAEQELIINGWKKHKIKSKDYSKAYVDVTGKLKEFSAEEIETEELVYG